MILYTLSDKRVAEHEAKLNMRNAEHHGASFSSEVHSTQPTMGHGILDLTDSEWASWHSATKTITVHMCVQPVGILQLEELTHAPVMS